MWFQRSTTPFGPDTRTSTVYSGWSPYPRGHHNAGRGTSSVTTVLPTEPRSIVWRTSTLLDPTMLASTLSGASEVRSSSTSSSTRPSPVSSTVTRGTTWAIRAVDPRNPVLTHRSRVGHSVQSTGHAELLDDVHGHWWALFLGTRHHGPTPWHQLGRETFLAPVRWDAQGWPVIGDDGTVELDQELPHALPPSGPTWPHDATPWTSGWATREVPADGLRLVPLPDGGVRVVLPASGQTLDDEGAVAAVFRTQEEFAETFEATLLDVPSYPGRAGVAVYASPEHHYDLTATLDGSDRRVTLRKRVGDMATEAHLNVLASGALDLQVEASSERYTFRVRSAVTSDDQPWVTVGRGLARLVSAETTQAYSAVKFVVLTQRCDSVFTVAERRPRGLPPV